MLCVCVFFVSASFYFIDLYTFKTLVMNKLLSVRSKVRWKGCTKIPCLNIFQ